MRFTMNLLFCVLFSGSALAAAPPNIMWIVVEDASPHIGCYGETLIKTPHIDRLATDGVLFENAYVTSPVCSPSRSAMVAGMFQTTLGAHNHRSQGISPQRKGNKSFYESYRVPESIRLIPELFRDAGYYVVNGGIAKTDYNFIPRSKLYSGTKWQERKTGQPFFAQIQLTSRRVGKVANNARIDPQEIKLPPYYPNDPVLLSDWTAYLNRWSNLDAQVAKIVQELQASGELENTAIFFWTDHGVAHLRGKQFLYEEGAHVPLIVRLPQKNQAGTIRKDLVTHIDVGAASLALAGIPIPAYIQGQDLFAKDYQPQSMVFGARDRCDETVDTIRSVRTPRYKYIRNFLSYASHMQPNQYKLGLSTTKRMQALYAEGKLNEFQGRIFAKTRPPEELYDLLKDPHEQFNLAGQAAHQATLQKLRTALEDWMISSGDLGLIPEPLLEELGRKHGNKYFVLQQPENQQLNRQLLDIIAAGQRKDAPQLQAGLSSSQAAVRYWAATYIGYNRNDVDVSALLQDKSASVRIAAALAVCQAGDTSQGLPVLEREIKHPNLFVGMYAMRAVEELGPKARPLATAIAAAQQSLLQITGRIARRVVSQYRIDRYSIDSE